MTWWAWLLVGWVPFAVLLARLLGAAARAIHARDQRCWESSPRDLADGSDRHATDLATVASGCPTQRAPELRPSAIGPPAPGRPTTVIAYYRVTGYRVTR